MDRRVTRSMKRLEEERIHRVGRRIMERTMKLEEAVYPIRRKIMLGVQSVKGKKVKKLKWTCPQCNKVNHPERRLLAVLPVTRCACGRESNVEFDFSLHKMELNDQFLIPHIRKQKPKECSPCSMLSLAEISWRVNAILNGQVLGDCEPKLSRFDLLEKYNYLCDACKIRKRWNQRAVETLIDVISTIGVQSSVHQDETDDDESNASNAKEMGFESEASKTRNQKVYILPYYSAVKKDFSAICRLLGDGFVVRTSFYAGRNFKRLKPGEIYKSPGRGRVRHAIVIVGAGRRGLINYYYFLNSWGKLFCLRILKRGVRVGKPKFRSPHGARNTEKASGGFGLLRASDIIARPVTFLRHKDDFKYYKDLLHKDIVPPVKIKEGPEEGSNTCSKTSELRDSTCSKLQEGISLIDSPHQRLATNGPQQLGALPVDGICSPGDEAAFADLCCFAGHKFRVGRRVTTIAEGRVRRKRPTLRSRKCTLIK